MCLVTDDTLPQDNRIDHLNSRWNSARYAITAVQCCQGTLSECYNFLMYILSYPTA